MTQLYALAQEHRAIADKLADLELDDQTIADTLEGMSGALEAKATNVAMFVRNLEATAAAIKSAEGDMAARRKAIESRAANLSRYLLASMQHAGLQKIESPHFALTVRSNPASVDVFDTEQIPEAFMRFPAPPPATPDKVAIKDALKAGQDVPGARLTQGVRLDIR